MEFVPFNFDSLISTKNFEQGIIVKGQYKDKRLYLTTDSLGGRITVIYKNHIYRATVEDVELTKFIELLGNKKHVKSGKINGTVFYHKRPREGYTKLVVSDAVLKGLDLDKKLSTINDALNFQVNRLMNKAFFDSNASTTTNIDHLQFNIYYKDSNITTTDVALRTDNYRISLDAHLHKKGHIHHCRVSLIDKNGCAIITQTLEGNIRKPKIKRTSTEIIHVAKSVPSSMFGMGMEMLGLGSVYSGQDENFMGAKSMMNEADHYMQETSNVVMPLGCSKVYIGEVSHPMYD